MKELGIWSNEAYLVSLYELIGNLEDNKDFLKPKELKLLASLKKAAEKLKRPGVSSSSEQSTRSSQQSIS